MAEAAWYVVHLEDVLSDLSAVHRYRRAEALSLTAGEFFALASRLVHYPGVVRDLTVHRIETQPQPGPESLGVPQGAVPDVPTAQVEDPSESEVQAMRNQARRRRFPSFQFGEHQHKPIGEALREAAGA